eukprot:scaffold26796_cov30-Tisochrysis_lutea.AAC.5
MSADVVSGSADSSGSPWILDRATLDNSPSLGWLITKCGGDEKAARRKEDEYRKLTCAFIQDTGRNLRLCASRAHSHAQAPLASRRPRADLMCGSRDGIRFRRWREPREPLS